MTVNSTTQYIGHQRSYRLYKLAREARVSAEEESRINAEVKNADLQTEPFCKPADVPGHRVSLVHTGPLYNRAHKSNKLEQVMRIAQIRKIVSSVILCGQPIGHPGCFSGRQARLERKREEKKRKEK
ncbi:uncharacterized protein MCYG_01294 [Microsporum canis CBS 113480]|uniref:Uncharacterized protein n=1 Tax=Arthroderma otae (strain ATCC MYA-4605 / CBS 113480) TaxID=554155 RepID=C5FET2_ARTOC|nr:uncharacterized protein MCYG_01294 [Microsporum canis CBS 113480]EEQ28406.1 predicted protein [Microsporum canis CBS 113480]